MRINRLVLKDFGLFRGEQVINLAPRVKYNRERPVILVGGHNGAGKTTILDALRLCLYGRLALGTRTRESDYSTYLRERIHRDRFSLIPRDSASVGLEFEYARDGVRSKYYIQRSWQAKGRASVVEDLHVERDGHPLADVEKELWSDFVRSLIPPGLSQLFFFDGEKIQRLADEDGPSEALADAVKALLGLDIVERLQADLDMYVSRQVRSQTDSGSPDRLEEIEKVRVDLQGKLDLARQDEAQLRAQLDYLLGQIERVEQKLAQSGQGLSDGRAALKQREQDLRKSLEQTEHQLRDLCEGPLPIAAARRLAGELVEQLRNESELDRHDVSAQAVLKALKKVEMHLTGAVAKKLKWPSATRALVSGEIASISSSVVDIPDKLKSVARIHNVSLAERDRTRELIHSALRDAASSVAATTERMLRLEAELKDAIGRLNRIPDDSDLAPLIKELSRLQDDRVACQGALNQKTADRERLDRELTAVARERTKVLDTRNEAAKAGDQLALATRARRALDQYLIKLTAAKISQIETTATDCFNHLSRKDSLISGMKINSSTFEVGLIDGGGHPLSKAELSAGEKQIYAIAILWALAKVSGRPLPMIIDTPLGRLDSIHRQKLVDGYFPIASHQVIVLSTDTEVDQACFERMRLHTSHAIRLTSHPDGWTEAQPGYFWTESDDAAA